MRILHGISSVGIQATRYLSDELRRLGHDSQIVVYRGNPLLVGYEDQNLGIDPSKPLMLPAFGLRVARFFLHALRNYDVYHFHFGHSLLPLNLDLPLLRVLGKRVIMEYHGSDVRRRSVFELKNPFAAEFPVASLLDDRTGRRRQRRIARYVNAVIVQDAELREHLFPFTTNVHTVPLRTDLSKFGLDDHPPHGKIVIAHAPSRSDVKGTTHIVEAVDRLSRQYDLGFKLVTGASHDEVLRVCAEADIVIDQLLLGTYGMLSVEGMALGKPVVCYIRDDLLDSYGGQLPICQATVETVEAVLQTLVEDPALRQTQGRLGRAFVEEIHDVRALAAQIVDLYAGNVVMPRTGTEARR